MGDIWNYMCVCVLGLSLVSCGAYVKPTATWEKEIARGGKPSVKTKVEVGKVFDL